MCALPISSLRIPLGQIQLLRTMPEPMRRSVKYGQIAASIREVGIIEPPVVVRLPGKEERYRLLDGHMRIDVLKERGDKEIGRAHVRTPVTNAHLVGLLLLKKKQPHT